MKNKKILIITLVILCLIVLTYIVINKGDIMKNYVQVSLLDNKDLSYSNPLNINYIGDPFVLSTNGKYYCFPTSATNGFNVWSSDDLVDWKSEGIAYKRTGSSWSGDSYWAPEVVEYNSKYYMFYTARTLNNPSLKIGLAISDKPEGPYIDYDNKPFYDPGYAVIDASILIDDDGRKYMYYSIDCSENIVKGNHESHIAVVELADDLMSVISEPTVLSKPEFIWEKVGGNAWAWNEGPIILKQNNKYYMFYSANFYASTAYCVGYSVSNSPTGPFVKSDKPLLWYSKTKTPGGIPEVSGPGHNSLAFSPDKKELFIVYHTHMTPEKPSGDRQVAIDRIGFRDDGTIYANGPTTAPQPLPSGVKGYTLIKPDNINFSSETNNNLFNGEIFDTKWSDSWVEMNFNTAQNISTIAVYPSDEEDIEKQIFDVIINDKYIIPEVELENQNFTPGNCALLNFEPIETTSIKLVFKETASISEIMIYSKEIK